MKFVDEQLKVISQKGTIPVSPQGIMPLDRMVDMQRAAIICMNSIKSLKEPEYRAERIELLKKSQASDNEADWDRYKNLIKQHLQQDQVK